MPGHSLQHACHLRLPEASWVGFPGLLRAIRSPELSEAPQTTHTASVAYHHPTPRRAKSETRLKGSRGSRLEKYPLYVTADWPVPASDNRDM
eukprot:9992073-Alexandrium_andersonii.AAC.1